MIRLSVCFIYTLICYCWLHRSIKKRSFDSLHKILFTKFFKIFLCHFFCFILSEGFRTFYTLACVSTKTIIKKKRNWTKYLQLQYLNLDVIVKTCSVFTPKQWDTCVGSKHKNCLILFRQSSCMSLWKSKICSFFALTGSYQRIVAYPYGTSCGRSEYLQQVMERFFHHFVSVN